MQWEVLIISPGNDAFIRRTARYVKRRRTEGRSGGLTDAMKFLPGKLR